MGETKALGLADATEQLLRNLLEPDPAWRFEIELWDGRILRPPSGTVARMVIREPSALKNLFLGGNTLAFAESYLAGEIDLDGDLPAVIALADALLSAPVSWKSKLKFVRQLVGISRSRARTISHAPARLRGKVGSRSRSTAAISYHYDRPIEFWSAWLDRWLQYTCAYFGTPQDSLEQAQERKLELICRKLALAHGKSLLDIGCGWGGLMVYAAKRFGTKSVGVTLSEQQAEHALTWIKKEGLSDQCQILLQDFRDIGEHRQFDAVSGVGVLEHLGPTLARDYFNAAFSALSPGGRFLNQAIAPSVTLPLRGGRSFMDAYVFPDTELMPISRTLNFAEAAGFEVRDVENLREHYHLTLSHWLNNLESGADALGQTTSDGTFRAFRLYLAGCAHDFQQGRISVYQSLFAKPASGRSGFPLTRTKWLQPLESKVA